MPDDSNYRELDVRLIRVEDAIAELVKTLDESGSFNNSALESILRITGAGLVTGATAGGLAVATATTGPLSPLAIGVITALSGGAVQSLSEGVDLHTVDPELAEVLEKLSVESEGERLFTEAYLSGAIDREEWQSARARDWVPLDEEGLDEVIDRVILELTPEALMQSEAYAQVYTSGGAVIDEEETEAQVISVLEELASSGELGEMIPSYLDAEDAEVQQMIADQIIYSDDLTPERLMRIVIENIPEGERTAERAFDEVLASGALDAEFLARFYVDDTWFVRMRYEFGGSAPTAEEIRTAFQTEDTEFLETLGDVGVVADMEAYLESLQTGVTETLNEVNATQEQQVQQIEVVEQKQSETASVVETIPPTIEQLASRLQGLTVYHQDQLTKTRSQIALISMQLERVLDGFIAPNRMAEPSSATPSGVGNLGLPE